MPQWRNQDGDSSGKRAGEIVERYALRRCVEDVKGASECLKAVVGQRVRLLRYESRGKTQHQGWWKVRWKQTPERDCQGRGQGVHLEQLGPTRAGEGLGSLTNRCVTTLQAEHSLFPVPVSTSVQSLYHLYYIGWPGWVLPMHLPGHSYHMAV